MRLIRRLWAVSFLSLLVGCAPVAAGGIVAAPATAPSIVSEAPPLLAVEVLRDVAIQHKAGSLLADIVFPVSGGPYPVVVFSHGSGGTPNLYRELTSHWAAAGFVVIAPTHADSRRVLRGQGLERQDLARALLSSANDPSAWDRRVSDISAIIDAVPRLATFDARLAGRADPERVGVGGHSFGAFTSMLVACARPRLPSGEAVSLRDPRPDAFLLLSAQGVGQQGLEAESWSSCDRPMMVVTGTEDRGRSLGERPAQTWREKLEPFRLSPAGGKVAWVLQGAAHSSFVASDRSAAGALGPAAARDAVDPALQVRLFAALAAQTTLWWRAQLKSDAAAGDAVASGAVAQESGVTALYQTR